VSVAVSQSRDEIREKENKKGIKEEGKTNPLQRKNGD